MSLRLKINLIVAALTLLFAATVLALQLRSMRDSVHEEVVAANRVAAQLLQRTVWRYAAQGESAMLAFLQGMGRIRSNDITLFDAMGRELYRSPPATYKAGRDAPEWFSALIGPPPSGHMSACSVHHQYSSSDSPFHANTGMPRGCDSEPSLPTATAAAA